MSDGNFGIQTLGQIFVPAQELERAVAFYRDTLGMTFLFEDPPRMAFFDLNGIRLMLGEPEGGRGDRGSILYYKVPDMGLAHETLVSRGVEFDVDPHFVHDMGDHELWLAFFKDSEQNQLALMCEVAKSEVGFNGFDTDP